jgi:hypothetical protein
MTRTVSELERDLRQAEPDRLTTVQLASVRARGRRRRRARLATYAGGTAAVVLAAALAGGQLTGSGGGHADDPGPAATQPKELSPLAERALGEIAGAVQVSDWQVVIPEPAGAKEDLGFHQTLPATNVEAGPVDIGTHAYTGVTAFKPTTFPAWLHDGVSDWEHAHGQDNSYPVGSKDMGIIVDAGPQGLACMTSPPDWGGDPTDGCYPALVSGADGDLSYDWGMGTDDFLKEGKDLELFSTPTYVAGTAQTVWIGGTYGTDVASVDLVTTDGTTVSATVASGTLVPDNTMFWGTVDGELAQAVTRDAEGNVLEQHELKPCADPVSCEVR